MNSGPYQNISAGLFPFLDIAAHAEIGAFLVSHGVFYFDYCVIFMLISRVSCAGHK